MLGVGAGYLVLLLVEQLLRSSGHTHSHGTTNTLIQLHTNTQEKREGT